MRAYQEGNLAGVRGQGLHCTPPPSANAVAATETLEPPPEVRRDSGTILARPDKFPRTAIVLEMAAVADRLRIAARAIDHLCAHAIDYDPSTLRRKAHALVRLAWADVAGRVVLTVACMLAVACGGSAEPSEPMPIAEHCVVAPDQASYLCDGRPDPAGLAFSRECTLLDSDGPAATPYHWVCK